MLDRRMGDPDERALLRECIQGSVPAWESLVEQYGQAVYDAARFTLRRVLGSVQEEDIDNVYQGVFLGLCDKNFHRLRLFQSRSSFKTWITSVTTRFALNYIRTEKRKGSLKYVQLDDTGADPVDRDLFSGLAAEEHERLYQAIARLPVRERLAVKLFYFDGLSYKAIAEVLKVPLNSVSPLMLRAKDSLKRFVGSRTEN